MSTFLLHEIKGLFKSIQRSFEGSSLSHGETFCPNMSALFLASGYKNPTMRGHPKVSWAECPTVVFVFLILCVPFAILHFNSYD